MSKLLTSPSAPIPPIPSTRPILTTLPTAESAAIPPNIVPIDAIPPMAATAGASAGASRSVALEQ